MKKEKYLLRDAYKIVKETNNYSTSFLQRMLGIGYNRAGNLMAIIQKKIIRKGNRRLKSKKNKKIRYVK